MMKKFNYITRYSPVICTDNMGDYIIDEYCNSILEDIFRDCMSVQVPTRDRMSRHTRRMVATSDFSFVLGTNILSSQMNRCKQWNVRLVDSLLVRLGAVNCKDIFSPAVIKEKFHDTHIILLGAGWRDYQKLPDLYTKKLFNSLLDKNYLHSVRDGYTEQKLRSIGITNVLNTSCPTMWNLSEEHCRSIPTKKAQRVIATLTDYREDVDSDRLLLDILLRNYKEVYIWIQGMKDYSYLSSLGFADKVKIVAPTLQAYDAVLEDTEIDYIGTRLHGGIRALNKKRRTCILAVDNRAKEISKDTRLPIVDRDRIGNELENWINKEQEMRIVLPKENIMKWKRQFTTFS